MTFTCPTCLLEYKTKQGFVLHFPYIGYIFRLKKNEAENKETEAKSAQASEDQSKVV